MAPIRTEDNLTKADKRITEHSVSCLESEPLGPSFTPPFWAGSGPECGVIFHYIPVYPVNLTERLLEYVGQAPLYAL